MLFNLMTTLTVSPRLTNDSDRYRGPISEFLAAWSGGNREALNELIPAVYQELRKQARRHLREERAGHTLQTTALVHEAYLKLAEQQVVTWESRAHFFWVASEMMRRVLVDHARGHNRIKRGVGVEVVPLDSEIQIAADTTSVDLLSLDDALIKLADIDEQQAKMVEMRYFGGCSIEQTAELLGISVRTVNRDWAVAKAWLRHELEQNK